MSDAILSKVRKLLAKAEDPACTPAEAEALTAKATELIAKYGVDQALLAARAQVGDPLGDRSIDVPPPFALDKTDLLSAVAGGLRCRAVRWRRREGFTVRLFGFASDLDRAELLYTSLLVQAAHGLAALDVPAGEHPAAYRRSWLQGFRSAIAARLREAEARAGAEADQRLASAGGPSTALVLADRSVAVTRLVEQTYPRARTAPPRRLSGGGARSGVAAGRRANLGGAEVSTVRADRALPA